MSPILFLGGVPVEQRLRRALKFAGRGCGLQCVHVEEIEPGDVAGVIRR
jgi:hypothetical protein